MSSGDVQVAVVGAGPYGLSIGAHLADAGIEARIFGTPMSFWSAIAEAAEGRYLKSFCFGTNIYTPGPGYGFAEWSRARGLESFEPCSMRQFADYGIWVQQTLLPAVDRRNVAGVRRDGTGFRLTLEDGSALAARRVVLATGLSRFHYLPGVLDGLPAELCVHTTDVRRYDALAGKDVAVIGAGQSALEAAALLVEAGARPTLIARDGTIRWMTATARHRSFLRRLRSPLSDLGSGPKAWLLTNLPGALHYAPDVVRARILGSHLPPEGAWWLRDRLEGKAEILLGTRVSAAKASGGGCEVVLQSRGQETRRRFDTIVCGTGFEVDVGKWTHLDQEMRDSIVRIGRAPRLDRNFETSARGLHVAGPASSASFGPLFRFVAGARYTARVVARHLRGSK